VGVRLDFVRIGSDGEGLSAEIGVAVFKPRGELIGNCKLGAGTGCPAIFDGRGYITLEALDLPADWDLDAAFAYGVRLILDGVEAALRRHNREKNAHIVVGKRSGSMRTKLEQRP
jgi:hypothetical protein